MLHRIPPTHSASDLSSAVEQSIGRVTDYKVGDKKEVKVGDATALIVCTKKGLYAVGSKCTHYGAPLEKGVLDGCRLKCPWHGAVFQVETGDVEEAPAIDAIPSYPLRVDSSGEVFVQVPQTDDSKKSARKHIIPPNALCSPPLSTKRFAIVGGGAAGLAAADTLRQAGFQGEVHVFTRESNPPYDRPQLSKDLTKGLTVDKIYLRSKAELTAMKVDVHYGTKVVGLDSSVRTLRLEGSGVGDGTFRYDEVLFCTGSGARKLEVKGHDLQNVFTIRAPEEAAAIANALKAIGDNKADVVIVGSGFIGMEVAAFLSSKKELARSVTVVDRSKVPMAKQLGEEVGRGLQRNHEKQGVKFVLESGVEAVVDDGQGRVSAVQLKGGATLGCQVVVVALGAVIQTDVLKADKAVELSDKGEVIVDSHYRNKSGIYAAGDIGQHTAHSRPSTRSRPATRVSSHACVCVCVCVCVRVSPRSQVAVLCSRPQADPCGALGSGTADGSSSRPRHVSQRIQKSQGPALPTEARPLMNAVCSLLCLCLLLLWCRLYGKSTDSIDYVPYYWYTSFTEPHRPPASPPLSTPQHRPAC